MADIVGSGGQSRAEGRRTWLRPRRRGLRLGGAVATIGLVSTVLTIQAASAVSGGRVIGNRMWSDLNHNGRQDRGEPSIPGVKVWLHDTNARPWRWVGSQTTNRDGRYGFKNLRPGCYAVSIQVPRGMSLTRPHVGTDRWDNDFDTSKVARRCIRGNDWQIDGGFVPGGGSTSTTTTTTTLRPGTTTTRPTSTTAPGSTTTTVRPTSTTTSPSTTTTSTTSTTVRPTTSTTAPATTTTAAPRTPTGVASAVIASGLSRPWQLRFPTPDSILVTERPGRLTYLSGGTKRTTWAPADMAHTSAAAMMGMALDPSFASNRYAYVCFNSTLSGTQDVRVARVRIAADFGSITDRRDILTGIPTSATGDHSGCRLEFASDGYLWVTTGDAHMTTTAQNPQSLGGKILRITTTGAGAPGNPGGAFRPEVYNYGHRNVQGIEQQPSTGRWYSVEHGPYCDDEINTVVAGRNYGWSPQNAAGAYDDNQQMTDLARFPNAIRAAWSSGCPTVAPSGGEFINSPTWGTWSGRLVLAGLKSSSLFFFNVNGSSAQLLGTGLAGSQRMRDVEQAPDGSLYVVTDTDPGYILKVTPTY